VNSTKMTKDGRLVLVGNEPARIPDFVSEGLGRCRTVGNADDFTEDTRRANGYMRRARAAAVCEECPFAIECLVDGQTRKLSGVFGGQWLVSGSIQDNERKVRRRAA
jgi:hypothetical protein